MGLFSATDRFINRHSFFFNVSTNVLLGIISLICYALLIILFLKASWLQIESLVHVDDSNISPTVVITLITILLSGSTATLLTRAVEHSLWLKLVPREMNNRLTVAESRRLAQWSVSALSRLLYLFSGNSWLLRVGGILLLAMAAVNPVLLSGVSPTQDAVGSTSEQARSIDMFSPYIDRGNSAYNGGNFHDNPMDIAALASLAGMNAPASSVCSSPNCRVSAITSGLQAECQPLTMDNPEMIGLQGPDNLPPRTFCSTINPNLCTDLRSSDPGTFANFTTGPQGIAAKCSDAQLGSASSADCPGEWATIFGVWVNGVDYKLNGTYPIYAVDCVVRYGNVTVSQNGSSTPTLDRSSFIKSTYPLNGFAVPWHRVYIETGIVSGPQFALQQPMGRNLYTFTALAGGHGSNTLYQNTVGSLLLNYAGANGSDATTVARKIERTFDMSTLFAFAKAPDATERKITITESTPIWRYQPEVLAVLAIPLLATILVMIGRWRVGDYQEVVGYDPVEIARRGPVLREGLMGQAEEVRPYGGLAYHDDDADEKLEVWAVKTNGRGEGGSVRTRLVTG